MMKLSARILFEIGVLRCRAIDSRSLVNVYAEAERIRGGGADENVALEDIVDEIMSQCHDVPGFDLDLDEARNALMGLNRTYH